jgi:anthranilate synthase/aminodeoxychorismate synthase-like glutamine amidotransferase
MIIIIDNYDSFIYNLVRYVSELGYPVQAFRNDALAVEDLAKLNPHAIILSPGPCTPDQAGISISLIQKLGKNIPILGVCLGHQAIGQAYGGNIVRALKPVHGKSCCVQHTTTAIFNDIENPMTVGRYHSLIVEEKSLPTDLEIIATNLAGEIMALKHRLYPVFGVQFHPESILTPSGKKLLKNFLEICPANLEKTPCQNSTVKNIKIN